MTRHELAATLVARRAGRSVLGIVPEVAVIRIMADATAVNYGQLPGDANLLAGYVTGTPDIQWTAGMLATAAVTIDQAATGSPVPTATVRDVEPGAWDPFLAVTSEPWTAARPTIYCDRNDLTRAGGVLASGWQGDLWIAIPGWVEGDPLPAAPGCTIVAVQNDFTNPAYDLSAVLDPYWPQLAPKGTDMPILIAGGPNGAISLLDGGKMSHLDAVSYNAFVAAGLTTVTVSAAYYAQMLVDYPPGNPAITVSTTFPTYTSTPTP